MNTSPQDNDKLVFLDIDICDAQASYYRAAAFVEATDLRYNFSSKDILQLGGRELQAVADFYSSDFDWSAKGEIRLKPQEACRVVIRLLEESSPLACENFEALCTGSKGKAKASGLPLHFKGVKFHRIVPDFIIQGGDIVMQNGSGGESIYGKKFKDEKGGLVKKHNKAGIVSMCNSGKNSNTSQFFITLREGGCPQCDGKHVVFGEVVSGMEVIKAIETGVVERGGDEEDAQAVIIDCGIWNDTMLPQGYWAPNGLFCPPLAKESKMKKSGSTDVSAVSEAIQRHVDAIDVSLGDVIKKPLVIVMVAKASAIAKFKSVLEPLEKNMDVIYSAEIDVVVTSIEECYTNISNGSVKSDDNRTCSVLAGIIMGNTVADDVENQLVEACKDRAYSTPLCKCKPSDVLESILEQMLI